VMASRTLKSGFLASHWWAFSGVLRPPGMANPRRCMARIHCWETQRASASSFILKSRYVGAFMRVCGRDGMGSW
jgi:hypothetical protein